MRLVASHCGLVLCSICLLGPLRHDVQRERPRPAAVQLGPYCCRQATMHSTGPSKQAIPPARFIALPRVEQGRGKEGEGRECGVARVGLLFLRALEQAYDQQPSHYPWKCRAAGTYHLGERPRRNKLAMRGVRGLCLRWVAQGRPLGGGHMTPITRDSLASLMKTSASREALAVYAQMRDPCALLGIAACSSTRPKNSSPASKLAETMAHGVTAWAPRHFSTHLGCLLSAGPPRRCTWDNISRVSLDPSRGRYPSDVRGARLFCFCRPTLISAHISPGGATGSGGLAVLRYRYKTRAVRPQTVCSSPLTQNQQPCAYLLLFSPPGLLSPLAA